MPRCSHCNKWIVGGIREDDLRFCSVRCHEDGFLCKLVDGIDDEFVSKTVAEFHNQPCSDCDGNGPVDLYVQHTTTAFILHFTWKDSPKVCCRRCGVRHVLNGIIWTSFFGWWHFPFGVVAAPWQIINGLKQLFSLPDPKNPSQELIRMVKLDLANRVNATDS